MCCLSVSKLQIFLKFKKLELLTVLLLESADIQRFICVFRVYPLWARDSEAYSINNN